MAKPVYGFGMFGMGGAGTDPNEITFSQRVKGLGVDIMASPYRDYDSAAIAAKIDSLPPEAVVLVWGTSLGSNDCPVVASYCKHTIDGIWGFQASLYGAKVPIPANVKFAHLIYSYNPIPVPGLGMYKWKPGPGFDPASLHLTRHNLPHPGDWDRGDQNMFLGEMARCINAAQVS